MAKKLTRFEDMQVWQESMDFTVSVYKHISRFPKEEKYGLVSQMQRASSSISANIAEGFGRATHKDRAHFYHIALGSLLETKNFIYLAGRLDYLKQDEIDNLVTEIDSVHKQITAILKYFNNHG